jgi:hypothetical protein
MKGHPMTVRTNESRGTLEATSQSPSPPGAPGHDEWLIDQSIEETFPASDATLPVRPGSTLSRRAQFEAPTDAAIGRQDERTEEERRNAIAVAAYYNAERRGFQPGGEESDWLEAEQQIARAEERQRRRHAGLERAPDGEETTGRLEPVDPLPPGDAGR